MKWHRLISGGDNRLLYRFMGRIHGITLGSCGKIYGCLEQRTVPLGAAQYSKRLAGIQGHGQGTGICQTDILSCKPDHPPQQIIRIISRGKHPFKPVDSGIGITAPQTFNKCRNQIVMFFPGLVIQEEFFFNGRFNIRDQNNFSRAKMEGSSFKVGQTDPCIPVGNLCNMDKGLGGETLLFPAKSFFLICQPPL